MNPSVTSNSSIDEVTSLGPANAFRRAKIDPRADGIEGAKGASIAETTEQFSVEPAEFAEELEGDREYEQEHDTRLDEFTGFNPERDKERGKDGRRRRRRKIGKLKRAKAADGADFDEEEVFDFLNFLDNLWKNLSRLIEDATEEFDNWNNWFKEEKKVPPAPDPSKVVYIREEYNTKRSPHLWKSNPDRKWILTFGNQKINNVVSSILYKYQNETISKDA